MQCHLAMEHCRVNVVFQSCRKRRVISSLLYIPQSRPWRNNLITPGCGFDRAYMSSIAGNFMLTQFCFYSLDYSIFSATAKTPFRGTLV